MQTTCSVVKCAEQFAFFQDYFDPESLVNFYAATKRLKLLFDRYLYKKYIFSCKNVIHRNYALMKSFYSILETKELDIVSKIYIIKNIDTISDKMVTALYSNVPRRFIKTVVQLLLKRKDVSLQVVRDCLNCIEIDDVDKQICLENNNIFDESGYLDNVIFQKLVLQIKDNNMIIRYFNEEQLNMFLFLYKHADINKMHINPDFIDKIWIGFVLNRTNLQITPQTMLPTYIVIENKYRLVNFNMYMKKNEHIDYELISKHVDPTNIIFLFQNKCFQIEYAKGLISENHKLIRYCISISLIRKCVTYEPIRNFYYQIIKDILLNIEENIIKCCPYKLDFLLALLNSLENEYVCKNLNIFYNVNRAYYSSFVQMVSEPDILSPHRISEYLNKYRLTESQYVSTYKFYRSFDLNPFITCTFPEFLAPAIAPYINDELDRPNYFNIKRLFVHEMARTIVYYMLRENYYHPHFRQESIEAILNNKNIYIDDSTSLQTMLNLGFVKMNRLGYHYIEDERIIKRLCCKNIINKFLNKAVLEKPFDIQFIVDCYKENAITLTIESYILSSIYSYDEIEYMFNKQIEPQYLGIDFETFLEYKK